MTNERPDSKRSVPDLKGLLVVVCAVAILVGCSTQSRHKWLTRFFDGVPVPGASTNRGAIVRYDEDGRPLGVLAPLPTNVAAAVAPPFTRHPPYEERKCTECHESRFSPSMRGSQKQVCLSCHTPLKDLFASTKSHHVPAENGECTSCHAPHGSPNPKMVSRAGKALCAECHEDFLPKAKSRHLPVENGDCISCHNPHAS